MQAQYEVEPLFEHEHEYVVRARAEGQVIESRIRAEPDVLEQLGLQGTDEEQVDRETAVFLAGHQSVIDLPPMLDLADVIASYDDFPEQLRRHFTADT
jgi:hypothetical protein